MKRILLVLGVAVLVAVFGGLILLNPGEVEFRPEHLHSFHPTLGVLVIIAFLAGLLVAVVGVALGNAGSRPGGWRARPTPPPPPPPPPPPHPPRPPPPAP